MFTEVIPRFGVDVQLCETTDFDAIEAEVAAAEAAPTPRRAGAWSCPWDTSFASAARAAASSFAPASSADDRSPYASRSRCAASATCSGRIRS